jgi:hypothetical protein
MSFGALGNPMARVCSLNYDLEDYSDVLARLLTKFNLEVSDFYAYHDSISGDVFVNLTDSEGDSIDAIFMCDDVGVPGCSILSPTNDDEVGWIDLQGVLPMDGKTIIFGDGRWLRKAVLTNLMNAGKVDYQEVKESSKSGDTKYLIDEAFTMKGNRKVSIVTQQKRSRRLGEKQKMGLAAARRLHHMKEFKAK